MTNALSAAIESHVSIASSSANAFLAPPQHDFENIILDCHFSATVIFQPAPRPSQAATNFSSTSIWPRFNSLAEARNPHPNAAHFAIYAKDRVYNHLPSNNDEFGF